jgi:hypothetical protein
LCDIIEGYKTFESINIDICHHTIQIKDQTFYPSKIVTNQLKHSSSAALFICTAGEGISEYAKKISSESDPILGYVSDVIGSVTVEKDMNRIQDRIKEEAQNKGFSISDRYSPGYCEWSVSEQKKLFSLLPENFCNVKLSESSLMHPIKSISGIIGIGKGLKQKGYQCHWCSDKDCIYGQLRRKNNLQKVKY